MSGHVNPSGGGVGSPARYRLGFDIGGTFTDFVMLDIDTGELHTYKTLTTPDEPARAVIEGWNVLLERTEASPDMVEIAVHGTTLITNALIERRGATTGLITTRGFRDTLEMRREMRYDIYDLLMTLPDPLVPRPLRAEVDERLDARGEVVYPIDLEGLELIRDTFVAAGVKSIAVCFLHSFMNDVHEKAVEAWLKQHYPEASVSLSSYIAPEVREYERTSTTVTNAYVQPIAEGYLGSLATKMQQSGFKNNLYMMLSHGGVATVETAIHFPIRMVESGPAAGVIAAVRYGKLMGEPDLVSFDMGGTTAKMCHIRDGKPAMASSFEVARVHRFKMGSGLPVQVRSIELIEIGAGGGSEARVDDLGLLKVGPGSAGADPGPACYGLGGTQPTVTDANVVLGYLNPDNFLGGRLRLEVNAARESIKNTLAIPMGISVEDAAFGIYKVVNENMISATRVHLAERAADPRRMLLLAFGGAGPVHADAIARALKMRGFVIPPSAGVASALGFLAAPVSFELARGFVGELRNDRVQTLEDLYTSKQDEAAALLMGAGVPAEEMVFVRQLDLRHSGQGHEIVVEIPFSDLSNVDVDTSLAPVFYEQYELVYGHAHRHLALESITARITALGPQPRIVTAQQSVPSESVNVEPVGSRSVYFAELGGYVDTPVYSRSSLHVGASFQGPAVVEEIDSTGIIGPDTLAVIDEYENLIVTLASS